MLTLAIIPRRAPQRRLVGELRGQCRGGTPGFRPDYRSGSLDACEEALNLTAETVRVTRKLNHRAIGIIQINLIKQSDWDLRTDIKISVPQIARRVIRLEGKLAEIMTSPVQMARQDTIVAELVPRTADAGLHQIPIVDQDALFVTLLRRWI